LTKPLIRGEYNKACPHIKGYLQENTAFNARLKGNFVRISFERGIVMKRITIRFFRLTAEFALLCAVLLAFAGSPATVSAQAGSQPDELDAAIREASTYLNGKVPKGSKVVFLNIKSDYPDLSEYILSILSENAVNDGVFSVVDRQQLDLIRAELNFQMSGEVSDKSAQSIGQMLGAQIIVSGAVNKIGTLYRIQVKAIEVQTAGVQGQWSRNVPTGATIAALTERYAPAPAGTPAPGQSPAAPGQTPAAPAPAGASYKIGDTGPAGGIVFYDKGYYSDGWQYLEAANRDAPTAHWGPNVNGTREGIGTGKQNTALIVRTDDTGTAAHRCQEYRQGEYNDWFLPSKDELNLMYQVLKQKGLGGFSNARYWSSSQYSNSSSWNQRFSDGRQDYDRKNNTYSVRPIRQF